MNINFQSLQSHLSSTYGDRAEAELYKTVANALDQIRIEKANHDDLILRDAEMATIALLGIVRAMF